LLEYKSQKAIIYIGASKPQIEGIKAAKRIGLYTVVTDVTRSADGARYADLHVEVSATDREGLLKLAYQINEKNLLVGCYGVADYAYEAIGAINHEFGLAGSTPEAFARAASKDVSKRIWKKYGLPTAEALSISEDESIHELAELIKSRVSFPVVVKPASSYNHKGITFLGSWDEGELVAAVNRGFRESSKVMIEEFIKGKHVNVDVLMLDGKGIPVSCTERSFYGPPGSLSSWGLHPADISESTGVKLYELAEEAARCLGLVTGPVTADIILSEGKPKLLEISPHYHSLVTNAIRDAGASIEAWFRFLSGIPINKRVFTNVSNAAAYLNLIGSETQLERFWSFLTDRAEIIDTEIRDYSEATCLMIVWLKGRDGGNLKHLLDELQSMAKKNVCASKHVVEGHS